MKKNTYSATKKALEDLREYEKIETDVKSLKYFMLHFFHINPLKEKKEKS